ncbi:hypothetical protein G6F46_010763 [Rhizopus delemar]|uniref:HMG box domain-containing protein n=3 Tax=Rhizopus TaxID=4842 RepID=I1BXL0_RHIO9|nr:hypothetical protein RO3G_05645 [Rhizopus delemar RA 99-880]KAG1454200.1 hypothetical protein G6F55_007731 [Rhizopus delemar]KAG1539605.1 hypothetical protein G6F51_009036 [Rhizopus arrhizus]KAG1503285.1 hypothetical protein G6F54_001776 [Rhizopus delemar]KAG1507906.1 hypothetical protein G6F53_008591 [Rhizopus delemar]|eukprot:EIE80940.1 hypothetical protein RO3G_05645 [Rhizopus delemar RA 99-880]
MTTETNQKTQEIHKAIDQLAGSLHHFTNLLFGTSPVEKADHVNKKKKVEKDPNAPKRNLSSYMLYSQAVRPKVAAEHPDMKAIEIAKLVGEMWNKLSEKEKAPYIKQAEKEKIRFEKENASYKTTLASEEKQQPAKRKERNAEEVTSEKKAKKNKKEKHAHRSEKSGDKKSKKKNF